MTSSFSIENRIASSECIAEVAAFYRSVRRSTLGEERFRWLYLNNPAGPANLHLLRTRGGELVGLSAAVPVRVHDGQRWRIAWNTTDFTLSPQIRTLGPALRLRRTLLDDARRLGVALVFAFPDAQFRRIHELLEPQVLGTNVRLIICVNPGAAVTSFVEERARSPRLAGFLSVCSGSWALSCTGAPPDYDADVCDWDDALSLLEQLPTRGDCVFPADREWLAWRFRDFPTYRNYPCVVYHNDRPVALFVLGRVGEVTWLKYVWPPGITSPVLSALGSFLARTRWLCPDGMLRADAPAGHWLERVVRTGAGFRRNGDSITVIYYALPRCKRFLRPASWERLVADRDI